MSLQRAKRLSGEGHVAGRHLTGQRREGAVPGMAPQEQDQLEEQVGKELGKD